MLDLPRTNSHDLFTAQGDPPWADWVLPGALEAEEVPMLLSAIPLDAEMSVSAVLERLARNGLWLNPQDPAAKAWIQAQAKTFNEDFDAAARRLARDPKRFGVAIRRQVYANILWYALPAEAVLRDCAQAVASITLREALDLSESESLTPLTVGPSGELPSGEGVVLDGDRPVAVSLQTSGRGTGRVRGRGLDRINITVEEEENGGGPTAEPRSRAGLWPHLDCPQYVPAGKEFLLTVGLAEIQQKGTAAAGALTLTAAPGSNKVDLTVELTADGLDAPDGWSRDLQVSLDHPTSSSVSFRLIGRPPQSAEPHLTTLEVRYVSGGSILGTASRPLVIGHPGSAGVQPIHLGAAWLNQPEVHTAFTLAPDEKAPDLTIELTKPDRNQTTGKYVCRLYSPHQIKAGKGPYEIDLGTDAKSFVKQYVDALQQFNTGPLVDNALRTLGDLVARQLPAAALEALGEVAVKVAPEPPTLLIVSAEPYVPWELASFDRHPLLDADRPPYLGAQAVVGRWLHDPAACSGGQAPTKGAPGVAAVIDRPPARPPASIDVRLMAVMAGLYKKESNLNALPGAEQEAAEITKGYNALELSATPEALAQLLNRDLQQNFKSVGGADAIHFAGHGYFDKNANDSSMLYLSDGTPVSSMLFRSAKYGGAQQPLFFLNACMIGTGDQLLNDMGGFPGNCLRGGFGGLIGAFWVVDDNAARDIAVEFWRRVLALENPEPVARVLRDIRSKYDPKSSRQATYLAYVFYGHPGLSLRRPVAPSKPAVEGTQQAAPAST